MRAIIIDVTRLVGRFLKGRLPTGVDRVSLAYIDYFSGRALALVRIRGRSVVFSESASRLLFYQLLARPKKFKWTVLCLVARACLNSCSKSKWHNAFLFNTGHSGLENTAYQLSLRQQGMESIFFVHDLIPITHPEYCREGELEKHTQRMKNVFNFASGVMTNSQDTLNELARWGGSIGQLLPPSAVALLAPPALPQPLSNRPLKEPYFVVLSTIEPRKNHWLLLQIWRRLVETLGAQAPKLVVIGQRGWECENTIDLLERCTALRDVVYELPRCSDAKVATYLHHAQALLFPSFAEGYGMPLVEALSVGVPVIASDLPAFREIAGDVPDYLDPLDGPTWLRLIQQYTESDSSARCAQLKRIEQFTAPTWSAHFQAVEELLERLQ